MFADECYVNARNEINTMQIVLADQVNALEQFYVQAIPNVDNALREYHQISRFVSMEQQSFLDAQNAMEKSRLARDDGGCKNTTVESAREY